MSYPPVSHHYGSSNQPTIRNGGYTQPASYNHMYPSSTTSSGNAPQSVSYGASGYEHSGQSGYASSGTVGNNIAAYSGSTNYEYSRAGTSDHQESALSNAYPQGYYGRNSRV